MGRSWPIICLFGPVERIGGHESLKLDLCPKLLEMFGEQLLLLRHGLPNRCGAVRCRKAASSSRRPGLPLKGMFSSRNWGSAASDLPPKKMIAKAARAIPLTAIEPHRKSV